MIALTRLNGQQFVINAEKIRYVESTPDTVVCCDTGEKMMVKDSRENMRRIPTTMSKTGSERSVSAEKFTCSSTPFQCGSVNPLIPFSCRRHRATRRRLRRDRHTLAARKQPRALRDSFLNSGRNP